MRLLDAEKVLFDLRRIADEINIAKVDRIVRLELLDQLGDLEGLIRAGAPVAGKADADVRLVGLERIDPIGGLLTLIGEKGVLGAEPILYVFSDPADVIAVGELIQLLEDRTFRRGKDRIVRRRNMRRSGGLFWRQGFGTRYCWERLFLQIGDGRRTGEVFKVLQVLGAHGRRWLVGVHTRPRAVHAWERLRKFGTGSCASLTTLRHLEQDINIPSELSERNMHYGLRSYSLNCTSGRAGPPQAG